MRKSSSVILLVLAAVLSIPAVVLLWVQRDIVNVNRFTETARGVLDEPGVQADISDRVTVAVMEQLHVPELIDSAADELPPRLSDALHKIEPALDSAVNDYVSHTATSLVGSSQFAAIWDRVNRIAHEAVFKLLQGQGDSVTLDLAPVVQELKTRLVNRGFGLAANIPDLHPTYTLASSPKIAKARDFYSAFEVLRWLIPVLALVFLAAGVLLARNRWRALMWGAIGIALAMGAGGGISWIARGQIGEGRAIFDAFAAPLHSMLRWVLLSAVVVAGTAYLIGYRRQLATPP